MRYEAEPRNESKDCHWSVVIGWGPCLTLRRLHVDELTLVQMRTTKAVAGAEQRADRGVLILSVIVSPPKIPTGRPATTMSACWARAPGFPLARRCCLVK